MSSQTLKFELRGNCSSVVRQLREFYDCDDEVAEKM